MTIQRVAYLDGWRGLAILFVLLDHFEDFKRLDLGAFGVELFFVLSGRLMAELLVVQNTPWRMFLWRRFSRIYPALLVFCTLMLIISHTGIYPAYAPRISFDEFLAAILFVMNYAAPWLPGVVTIDHIWSLCVEEHSYLLLTLIVIVARRASDRRDAPDAMGSGPRAPSPVTMSDHTARHIWIAAGCLGGVMMASGIVQAHLTGQNEHELFWRTDVRAASVLIAFALYLFLRPLARLQRAAPLAPWIATSAFLTALIVSDALFPVWVRYSLGTLALALSVNTIDFAAPAVLSVLRARWLTLLGMLSYSLYLWQQPFYKFSQVTGIGIGLAGTAFAAMASYFLIEKPCRSYLNRLWMRRDAIAGVNPP